MSCAGVDGFETEGGIERSDVGTNGRGRCDRTLTELLTLITTQLCAFGSFVGTDGGVVDDFWHDYFLIYSSKNNGL